MDRLDVDDPKQIGPYVLVSRLGEGGMGRVYLGRSVGGRLVAVKVIRPDLANDAEFRARFGHEVAAAQRVNGFYTAAVVDADPDPGAGPPWLATAYVPGPSLAKAADACGPLPAPSLRLLAAGLAEALRAIHRGGVVHRDLKPGNVLLAVDGPRVIDFGIARATDRTRLTRSGAIGTAGFMAPEHAAGDEVTAACDVFAFGGVLAYAATARMPFGDGPPQAVIYRIVYAEPDLAGITEPLRGLIAGCLAKEVAKRPTAEDILAAIGFGPDDTVQATTGGWLPPTFATLVAEHAVHTPGTSAPSAPPAHPVQPTPSARQAPPPRQAPSARQAPPARQASPPRQAQAAPMTQATGRLPTTEAPGPHHPPAGSPASPPANRKSHRKWRYLVEPWGITVSAGLGTVSAAVTATMTTDPGWMLATGALVAGGCYAAIVGVGILTDPSSRRAAEAPVAEAAGRKQTV